MSAQDYDSDYYVKGNSDNYVFPLIFVLTGLLFFVIGWFIGG